jgi:hypothetical protein
MLAVLVENPKQNGESLDLEPLLPDWYSGPAQLSLVEVFQASPLSDVPCITMAIVCRVVTLDEMLGVEARHGHSHICHGKSFLAALPR